MTIGEIVMAVLPAIIFGVIVGALGRLAAPDRTGLPTWLTVLVGVVGAVAGTGLANMIGWGFWGLLSLQIACAAAGVCAIAASWPRARPG